MVRDRACTGEVQLPVLRDDHAADEQLLWDLALNMEPEDGCLWIYGADDPQTMAFTDRGLEYLQELVAEHYRRGIP